MSVTAGDILRVVATTIWTDGNIMQNVFNAVVTGAGSPWADADIVADAKAWADDMYANITSLVSDELDGSQIQVYVYDAIDDDWDEVGSDTWTWNPTNTANQLPRGVAALINLKSSDPDISGKKYVGGFTDDVTTDGLWEPGVLTALALFAVDWYTGFVGGTSAADWAPGIWSVVETVFKLATASAIIPTIPAYQRRRKRGVGI